MRIERLEAFDARASLCAELLETTFSGSCNREEAEETITTLLETENVFLAAIEKRRVIGFIGALTGDYPSAAELHPLVVREGFRGCGVGRRLVTDLETILTAKGVLTVYLGTDDEKFQTSLSEGDLFEETFAKLAAIRNKKRHPYSFYEKLGYRITGVIPDANGWNQPDIIMAKRIAKR